MGKQKALGRGTGHLGQRPPPASTGHLSLGFRPGHVPCSPPGKGCPAHVTQRPSALATPSPPGPPLHRRSAGPPPRPPCRVQAFACAVLSAQNALPTPSGMQRQRQVLIPRTSQGVSGDLGGVGGVTLDPRSP